MVNLKAAPFNLDDKAVEWINSTLKSMSEEQKIGQLFCPIGYSSHPGYLQHELLSKHIGGVMFRDAPSEETYGTYRYLQENSEIPLLLAANLEAGGNGLLTDGTFYGKQMQIAAAGGGRYAYELGYISSKEGAAVGCNYAFAPVVDIDLNYHNPITNVRTFGGNVDTVIHCSTEYIRAASECGVAVAAKHFPGDGVDERDQHLLTSINSLTVEEWDNSFGKVFKAIIDTGALTIMAGHIALPAYQKKINPDFPQKVIPCTLSPELLQTLLREQLGFNGMIITDATPMVGFCAAYDRATAVPLSIASGCDMFLFNKDLDEDIEFMKQGIAKGILTWERVDEAIMRILATKAALGLHAKQQEKTLIPDKSGLSVVGCKEHADMARECADKAVTLVKDTQELLPIEPKKHRRVLLQILGDCASNERVQQKVTGRLTEAGFEVIPYEKENFGADGSMQVDNIADIKSKYDLVLYIGNIENASNKTTNRINWYTFFGLGNNLPWFVEEVRTLFISVANPYHLLDVPMIKTYINCYSNSDFMLDAAMDKVLGIGQFTGISPTDPFCGREELRF